MRFELIDKDMLESAIDCNTDANAQEARAIINAVLAKQKRPHSEACQADRYTKDVCEGMYADKCDDVIQLCSALRAVLALAGEDAQVRKIVEDAIAEHGA